MYRLRQLVSADREYLPFGCGRVCITVIGVTKYDIAIGKCLTPNTESPLAHQVFPAGANVQTTFSAAIQYSLTLQPAQK